MNNETSEKLISILESINSSLFVISQSQQVIARSLSNIDEKGLDVSADAVIEPFDGSLSVDITHPSIIKVETEQA
jgi:hypothetical protein